MRETTLVLGRADGGAIDSVEFADTNPHTKNLVVDDSCRMSLEVIPNQIAIDSKAEAEQLLSRIQRELDAMSAKRERYKCLVNCTSANTILRSVVDNFHRELSTDDMQGLRCSAQDSIATLAGLLATPGITSSDQRNLITLMQGLSSLPAAPSRTKTPGQKSLADFIGLDAAAVVETARRLGLETRADGMTDEDACQGVAAETERLEKKLVLARAQLAPLLDP